MINELKIGMEFKYIDDSDCYGGVFTKGQVYKIEMTLDQVIMFDNQNGVYFDEMRNSFIPV